MCRGQNIGIWKERKRSSEEPTPDTSRKREMGRVLVEYILQVYIMGADCGLTFLSKEGIAKLNMPEYIIRIGKRSSF